jgi:hypothetical protein
MNINELIDKAKTFVESHDYKNELYELCNIGLGDAEESLMTVLLKINAIRIVRGTKKIYLGESLNDKISTLKNLKDLGIILNSIVIGLKKENNYQMSRGDVVKLLADHGESDENYYTIIGILSSLDLITSANRGRSGGIKKFDKVKEQGEIKKAEEEISKSADKESSQEKHERVLYDSAAKEISSHGYQAMILGAKRRLPGEWNTPDIVAYKINHFKVLGGAELEIVTIEVKWSISKQAIAEAISHQKLSHRSFLMVHQEFSEIDKIYLSDLINAGLGLICKKEGEHKVIIIPQRNSPEKLDVDNFLDIVLEPDEFQAIKKDLAIHYFVDFYKPILPN